MARNLKRLWPWAVVMLLTTGCPDDTTGGGGDEDMDPVTADMGPGGEDMTSPDPDMATCVPSDELCNGLDDDCDGVVDNGFEGLGDACTEGIGACAAEGAIVCTEDGEGTICDAAVGEPAEAESCNGADDDCDGSTDEGFDGVGEACTEGVGACAAEGTTVCGEDGESVVCDATPGEPTDEVCDGVDNNCDGAVDEELGGMPCETGNAGVCNAGVTACVDGEATCEQAAEPGPEVCDGLDNDCNGESDDVEGLGEACEAGVGACAVAGTVVCTDDGPACDAVAGEPSPEVCDGVDNDCNGVVDDVEGLGEACEAGVGACAAAGTTVCGPEGVVCDAQPGEPGAEVCDGVDNDCNGAVDDVEGLGEDCSVGEGACAAAGTTVCGPEGVVCDAQPGEPGEEVCDEIDNDCNGAVDDVAGLGEACSVGVGACEAAGTTVCSPEGVVCDAEAGQPDVEACDGVDNDCNGAVDDVPGLGEDCRAGEGACAADGTTVCSPEGVVCDAVPGQPQPEACNEIDDDCNGVVDDPPVCDPGAENCAVEGDEDGNGLADCDDPACARFPDCLEEDCAAEGDEDGNGLADCDDPACELFPDCIPLPPEDCAVEGDEDGNGLADCDDPACVEFPDCIPPPPEDCAVEGDEDGNGLADCDDPACVEFPDCIPPPPEDCAVEGDEDGNGLADCDDPACAEFPDCIEPPEEDCAVEGDEDGNGLADCDDPACAGELDCFQLTPICGGIELPEDPRGFEAEDDIRNNGWGDGGNDAFDVYGRITLSANGEELVPDMSLGRHEGTVGGIDFVAESALTGNVWTYDIVPRDPANAGAITVVMTGNLGSDGSTARTDLVAANGLPVLRTDDVEPFSDPPVYTVLLRSDGGDTNYAVARDDVTATAADTRLPVTLVVAATYAEDAQAVADAIEAGCNVATCAQPLLPDDPQGYTPNDDIGANGWSDAGQDAFDTYGDTFITANGEEADLDMNLGEREGVVGGVGYRVESVLEGNVWRYIVTATDPANAGPVDVRMVGNLGSDGSTQRTDLVGAGGLPVLLTTEGPVDAPTDPPVFTALVPGDRGERGAVNYEVNGDNVTVTANGINLPFTLVIAVTFAERQAVADAIDGACNGGGDVPPPVEDCAVEGDEDGNGLADCEDPACAEFPACLVEDCEVEGDEDGNGLADCEDPACAEFPACLVEDCAVEGDEDGNGLADCEDPACAELPACVGIIGLCDGIELPEDPRDFQAQDDIAVNGWGDGGNDAFDGYGDIVLSANGEDVDVDMSLGRHEGVVGGVAFVAESTLRGNVWTYDIVPVDPANAGLITVVMNGNLGSDGATQSAELVAANGLTVLRTDDGPPFGDPPVYTVLVRSDGGAVDYDTGNVGFVTATAVDVQLPLTMVVALSYAEDAQVVANAIEAGCLDATCAQPPMPDDPQGYTPNDDIGANGWIDAGQDAFDTYGDTFITANGEEADLEMNLGEREGVVGGVGYRVESVLEGNVWRYIVTATDPANAGPVDVRMVGNLGSDGNTQRTDLVGAGGLPVLLTTEGPVDAPTDPPVFTALVPGDRGDRGAVNYEVNGDNVTVTANGINLPFTLVIAVTFAERQAVADAINAGCNGGGGVVEPLVEDCAVEGDEDGNGLADCADPVCAEEPDCQQPPQVGQIGSFVVSDGPRWSDPGLQSVSCVQACAQLFGGAAGDYGCSTVDGEYNGRAWLDGWGDGNTYCSDGNDGAEDFVTPEGGGAYDCGANGCSYSAYVNDHGCNRTNYCWRLGAPLPANQAYGHHGNCQGFDDCGGAENCANLACQNNGQGAAVSWDEGQCREIAVDNPDIVCNLFRGQDPNNLDEGWGPPGACEIPVVYNVVCGAAPPAP